MPVVLVCSRKRVVLFSFSTGCRKRVPDIREESTILRREERCAGKIPWKFAYTGRRVLRHLICIYFSSMQAIGLLEAVGRVETTSYGVFY